MPVPLQATPQTYPAPVPSPLERLFHEHHTRVYRAAYRITGSASDAEDVLQTVFLRLVRQQEPQALAKPASYLYRAAINTALDVVRGRRAALPLEAAEGDGPARGVASLPEVAELREALRAALGRLAPRAAEMFVLRYFDGCNHGEIARECGTSAAVVAVTLFRARRQLKGDLGRFAEGRRQRRESC
jgi:RNA polymerase sigma-70 factor, ECF subfamily